jgi:N-acetylglucosaminyldiphosphoundecaprenol N-acetyl-beta-D-mannosaminyltransferase
MSLQKEIYFNGINFFNLNYSEIKKKIKRGGLLVIPSGPGLSTLDKNQQYHSALRNSDIALFDSGYFCLLLKILKFINVKKFSGYKLLKNLFNDRSIKRYKFFLVDPTYKESIENKKYLTSIKIKNSYHYVAPIYKKQKIYDQKLLNIINKKKPKFIMINLGGNVQEVLGYYLKKKLRFNPTIICSGAAISFFTKQQAPINNFLDTIYLGWLIRIVFNPKIFLLRYLKAFKLFLIVYNNKVIVK